MIELAIMSNYWGFGARVSTYLYVIAGEGDSGPVKIGFSADPDGRLRSLQGPPTLSTCGSFTLRKLTTTRCVRWKRLLHRDLKHHRSRGEWFNLSPSEAGIR